MPEIGARFWKAFYAARAANWPLAAWQLKEMRKLLRMCEITRPKYTDDIEEWLEDDLDAADGGARRSRPRDLRTSLPRGRRRSERPAPALGEGVDRLEAPGHPAAGPRPDAPRLTTTSAHDRMMALLIEHGIRSRAVLEAMASVPREEFVLEGDRERAYDDRALAIDAPGQTISQPLMVAVVVEALELHAGETALDVGTGSGLPGRGHGRMRRPRRQHRADRVARRHGRGAIAASGLRRRGAYGRRNARRPGPRAVRRDRRRSGRSSAPAGPGTPARWRAGASWCRSPTTRTARS